MESPESKLVSPARSHVSVASTAKSHVSVASTSTAKSHGSAASTSTSSKATSSKKVIQVNILCVVSMNYANYSTFFQEQHPPPLAQVDEEKVWYCPICRIPYEEGADMIACDKCDDWFHW